MQIVFGLKISAKYEYKYHYLVSTIRILFEYGIIRSPLRQASLREGIDRKNEYHKRQRQQRKGQRNKGNGNEENGN